MKELSIEEKAKAYDGLIERLKDLKFACRFSPLSDTIEEMFPELKGSKNERIIRCIGMCLTDANEQRFIDYSISLKDCLDWLEKQGENNMGISEATKKKLEDNLNKALEKETPESWNEFLEKQGEQKGTLCDTCKKAQPSHSCQDITALGRCALEKRSEQKLADKVEPKFHEGEWIVTPANKVLQITSIEGTSYKFDNESHYWEICYCDEQCHLWTIQDAKNGDILISCGLPFIFKEWKNNCVSYGGINSDGNFIESGWCSWCSSIGVTPSAKEQRDLLFQKMKEAGYKWDAERKELIKIEQKQVIDYPDSLPKDNWELTHEFVEKFGRIPKDEDELNALVEYVLKRQKPAKWSEEDEKILKEIITDVRFEGYNNDLQGNSYRKINWLKSLKDRYTWKPSDKQMEALKGLLELINQKSMHGRELISLIEQLKKLMEE